MKVDKLQNIQFTKKTLLSTISIVLLLIVCAFAIRSCAKVEAGYVGVRVNLLGGNKGVDSEVLGVGRYWIGWNQELYLFPTFQQTAAWQGREGKSGAFQFQSKEGLSLSADMSLSFTVNPDMVSVLFQKYRKGIEEITNVYLYNIIRDVIVQVASSRTAESMYGDGKSAFVVEINKLVREKMQPIGINIDYIAIVGNVWLPQNVKMAIDEKVKAGQFAAQRETEVATARAEADKAVATAEGEARSKKQIADANAYAILAEATAQEKANQILAKSLTPELIQYNMATRWNGVLPSVTSGAVPFLNLGMK
ncbi:MAG: SPFH domain-containing protein [Bilophila wadsworthia]|uniref:SPFH domain-containing protein n=1 Tax=Bilophila wadsworthia TaxID=35833 RepID=UPI00290C04E2|nr:SPFH domain-containing protein [Bilophila wadsworthia]MDU4375132.1 SPFH domain-containing protein [Bilophila wadsworthia]